MWITAPAAEATELAAKIVTAKLAACVNRIEAVRSSYMWDGELQDEAEVLLMAKTTKAHLARLTVRICLQAWLYAIATSTCQRQVGLLPTAQPGARQTGPTCTRARNSHLIRNLPVPTVPAPRNLARAGVRSGGAQLRRT